MKISVALCTYNGERYLPELFESLLSQTRPPDELIVCDDRSTDSTPDLIDRFQKQAPFPVVVTENASNLGSTANFDQAISRCGGDVIALCDQDDVWLPGKLQRLHEAFQATPAPVLVFSDAEIVDQETRRSGVRLWDCTGFDAAKQRRVLHVDAFEVMRERMVVTGAAMAFRADLRPLIQPIPTDLPLIIHDGWITMVASAVGPVGFIAEPLLLYRQHPDQQVGVKRHAAPKIRTVDHYREHIRVLTALIDRLQHWQPGGVPDAAVETHNRSLAGQRRHIRARAGLSRNAAKRALKIAGELVSLRYFRYSNGFISAVKDLLYLGS